MKRLVSAGFLIVALGMLVACKIDDSGQGGGAVGAGGNQAANVGQGGGQFGFQATLDPTTAATFRDYNQTLVGMLYLNGTDQPIAKDQAAALLPIFEALNAPPSTLQPGETPAPGAGRRFNAQAMADTVSKVKAVLTPAQIALVSGMTQDQMTAALQEHNINNRSIGFGGFGNGGLNDPTAQAFATRRAQGTPFPTRDPNQIATFQAQRATAGPPSNPLIEAIIAELQAVAGS